MGNLEVFIVNACTVRTNRDLHTTKLNLLTNLVK